METENKPPQEAAADSIVLEEEIDPNYVPSEAEVVEYAKWLGMDLEKDHDLFWIAREGLMAPLPKDWKPCRTKDTEDIYYFNFTTGDSTWDHPCDGYYKRLYEEEKKKKETVIKESGDQNRSKAKQDVEQLLGKADKKKKKRAGSGDLGSIDMVKALPAPLGLHKKALPDISGPGRLGSAQSLGALGAPLQLQQQDAGRDLAAGKQLPKPSALTASLDGPRLSSFGSLPSHTKPLGSVSTADDNRASSRPSSAPADSARAEAKESDRASHDLKHSPVQEDHDDKEADRELGRLNVTAALNTKSRTLQGPSAATPAAAAPSRSSQPSAADDRDGDYSSRGKAERRIEESWRDDKDGPESRSRSGSRTQPTADDAPSPVLPSSSNASLQVELQRLRERCADLERKVEESEGRVTDYRTSYANAKDELVALERRYETSQSQWKEKLRALEVERDAAESERRRLKLDLLDLSDRAPAAEPSPQPRASDDTTALKELQQELRSAQAALARSAATHAELHAQMVEAEEKGRSRLADTEARRAAAVAECDRLTAALEAVKHKVSAVPESSVQALQPSEELLSELAREKEHVAAKEAENAKLMLRLNNEQARCTGLLEQIRTMGATGEARTRSLQDENAALMSRIEELRTTLATNATELETLRARAPLETALLQRAEAAEALHQATEKLLGDQRALEAALRKEMAEREKKQAEEQEHILSLQAEKNQNHESERGAQFEAYVSQATAVRKSLKSEIERLKGQVQELETEKANLAAENASLSTEKASLVTQLTRQETTLQFAKKELNDVAALRESSRQLEAEKQQLAAQLESAKDASSKAAVQLAELRERCDLLVCSGERDGEARRELSEENTRLRLAVETEKSVVVQKEKKIKSYQEELLQLQRRLAETTAAQASSPLFFSAAPAPLDSPVAMRRSSEINDLQAKLAAAQSTAEQASGECARLRGQVEEGQGLSKRLQSSVDQWRSTCTALQAQLESKSAELESSRQSLAAFLAQQAQSSSTAPGAATADASASLLQDLTRKVSQIEAERSALANQVRDLRSQVLSAELSLELQSSSTKIVEAEALSYKEKWVATERDLSELRMQHARAVSVAEIEQTGLQSQLSELQAINDVNARSAGELRFSRQESSNLRVALSEKESKLASALEELAALRLARVPTMSAAEGGVVGAAEPSRAPVRAPVPVEAVQPHFPAAAVPSTDAHHHHIVTLSMEVGRQQANMQRMEEHIRNTERLLLEFRGKAQKAPSPSSDDSVLPSAIRTGGGGRRGGSAEHFVAQTLAGDSPESVSLLPERAKRESARPRAMSDSESSVSPLRAGGAADQAAPSVSRDWVAALMRRYELHEHDGATVRGSDREGGNEYARATATRVLTEGKSRVKREGKFVKELQARCVAAKATLVQDQAAVKNLKSMWRNAKGRGDRGGATLSTDSINAITVQLNVSVDELRDAQSLAKDTERSAKALSQSLQYLEEILGVADSERQAQRLLQVTRQVQQKCVDSAADCAAYVSASRGKASSGKAVSWTPALQESPKRRRAAAAEDRPPRSTASAASRPVPAAASFMFDEAPQSTLGSATGYDAQHSSLAPSSSGGNSSRRDPPPLAQPFQPTPRPYTASLDSIQSNEQKAAILREQIHRITERQGLSQQIVEKHAGWLDNLHREISSVSHSYPRPVGAAQKENTTSSQLRTGAAASGQSAGKEGVTDFALQFEARASLSNSRRAFGDLQNRNNPPAAPTTGAGVLPDAYFTF